MGRGIGFYAIEVKVTNCYYNFHIKFSKIKCKIGFLLAIGTMMHWKFSKYP
jgi:hypothetical protein